MRAPRDLKSAISRYSRFTEFEPEEVGQFPESFELPRVGVCVGPAVHVAYRSDKWEAKNHDYIHEHEGGTRTYLIKSGDTEALPARVYSHKSLTLLGECLEIAFDEEIIKYKTPRPDLYCSPDGHCLYVVQGKRRVLAVTFGGKLNVTWRGIVG